MKSIVKYLIVDLDQSLCRIDISKEIFFKFFFASPLIFFKTLILLIKSKSEAKYFISKQKKIDCSQIPFNKNILELISFYKNNGYKIILATGLQSFTQMKSKNTSTFLMRSYHQQKHTIMLVVINLYL